MTPTSPQRHATCVTAHTFETVIPAILLVLVLVLPSCSRQHAPENQKPTPVPNAPSQTRTESTGSTEFSFDGSRCLSECLATKPYGEGDLAQEEATAYCGENCQDTCLRQCVEAGYPELANRSDFELHGDEMPSSCSEYCLNAI